MGIGHKLLLALLPDGEAWRIAPGGDYERLVRATGEEFDRLMEFFRDILAQAIPGQATSLLREWVQLFQIDPTLADDDQRRLAETYYTSTGNQSITYIQEQLERSGFAVTIEQIMLRSSECYVAEAGATECSGPGIVIVLSGTVENQAALQAVIDLWVYYAPLHRSHAVIDIKVRN